MIVTVAFICFVLGFGAAVAISRYPGRLQTNIVKLLNSISSLDDQKRSSSGRQPTTGNLPWKVQYKKVESVESGLFTREEIEAEFEPSSWQALAYEDFKNAILARESGIKAFPSVYATMGYRAGDHRYVFLKSDNPAEPQNIRCIAPALREYLTMARSLGPNTSLVIIAAPSEEEKSVEQYNNTFWEMLRGLRMVDPEQWPRDVPESVESEKWTFCFNGEPVFPVMLTPAHTQRWSRHMSVPLIALQPKWVLDELLSTPDKGKLWWEKCASY